MIRSGTGFNRFARWLASRLATTCGWLLIVVSCPSTNAVADTPSPSADEDVTPATAQFDRLDLPNLSTPLYYLKAPSRVYLIPAFVIRDLQIDGKPVTDFPGGRLPLPRNTNASVTLRVSFSDLSRLPDLQAKLKQSLNGDRQDTGFPQFNDDKWVATLSIADAKLGGELLPLGDYRLRIENGGADIHADFILQPSLLTRVGESDLRDLKVDIRGQYKASFTKERLRATLEIAGRHVTEFEKTIKQQAGEKSPIFFTVGGTASQRDHVRDLLTRQFTITIQQSKDATSTDYSLVRGLLDEVIQWEKLESTKLFDRDNQMVTCLLSHQVQVSMTVSQLTKLKDMSDEGFNRFSENVASQVTSDSSANAARDFTQRQLNVDAEGHYGTALVGIGGSGKLQKGELDDSIRINNDAHFRATGDYRKDINEDMKSLRRELEGDFKSLSGINFDTIIERLHRAMLEGKVQLTDVHKGWQIVTEPWHFNLGALNGRTPRMYLVQTREEPIFAPNEFKDWQAQPSIVVATRKIQFDPKLDRAPKVILPSITQIGGVADSVKVQIVKDSITSDGFELRVEMAKKSRDAGPDHGVRISWAAYDSDLP